MANPEVRIEDVMAQTRSGDREAHTEDRREGLVSVDYAAAVAQKKHAASNTGVSGDTLSHVQDAHAS